MCWKMGKEYFWDLREECPTGLNVVSLIRLSLGFVNPPRIASGNRSML